MKRIILTVTEKREEIAGENTTPSANTPPRPLFHANLAPRPLLTSFMLGFDTQIVNTLLSFAEDFTTPMVETNPSQDLFVEKFTMYSFRNK